MPRFGVIKGNSANNSVVNKSGSRERGYPQLVFSNEFELARIGPKDKGGSSFGRIIDVAVGQDG